MFNKYMHAYTYIHTYIPIYIYIIVLLQATVGLAGLNFAVTVANVAATKKLAVKLEASATKVSDLELAVVGCNRTIDDLNDSVCQLEIDSEMHRERGVYVCTPPPIHFDVLFCFLFNFVGLTRALTYGDGAAHPCPLESVASYLYHGVC